MPDRLHFQPWTEPLRPTTSLPEDDQTDWSPLSVPVVLCVPRQPTQGGRRHLALHAWSTTDNARTTALPTIFRTHPGRGNAPPGLLREREALLLSPGCVDPIHCVRPVGKTRLLQCSHSVLRWTRTDAV